MMLKLFKSKDTVSLPKARSIRVVQNIEPSFEGYRTEALRVSLYPILLTLLPFRIYNLEVLV